MKNKFLVECTYVKQGIKWIDTMIIKCNGGYTIADKKIRQFLTKKYENYQITDIRVNMMELIDSYSIK